MPSAYIKLELICDDFFDKRNRQHENFDWWLHYMRKLGPDKSPTQITDYKTGEKIKFIQGHANANSTGSRGIYAHYFLQDGLYRVSDRYKINKVHHYVILVENGKYRELNQKEIEQWLIKNYSA